MGGHHHHHASCESRPSGLLDEFERMADIGTWELHLSCLDDLSDNEVTWSKQSHRIFGYEPEAVGVTNGLFFLHVHPDDRRKIKEVVRSAL